MGLEVIAEATAGGRRKIKRTVAHPVFEGNRCSLDKDPKSEALSWEAYNTDGSDTLFAWFLRRDDTLLLDQAAVRLGPPVLLKAECPLLALVALVQVNVGDDELVAHRLGLVDDVAFWVDDHRPRDKLKVAVVETRSGRGDAECRIGVGMGLDDNWRRTS